MTSIPRYALAVFGLVLSGACSRSETSVPDNQAPERSPSNAQFEVIDRPSALSRADSTPSLCAENIRETQTGREYVRARSTVHRSADNPNDTLTVQYARGVYISNAYRAGGANADDSLHLDCLRMVREQPKASGE